MSRQRKLVASVLILAALASAMMACSKDDSGPQMALQAFLDGWAKGDLTGVPLIGEDGKDLDPTSAIQRITDLAGDLDPKRVALHVQSVTRTDDGQAAGLVDVAWTLVDGVVWPYQTTVHLRPVDKTWWVVLKPATVHPDLASGDHLRLESTAPPRGQIVDGSGQPIVMARKVVTVGIEPQRVTDQAFLLATLDKAFKRINVDVDLSGLPTQLRQASPGAFVEVVTLRREAYDQIRDQIWYLEGTVFREGELQLAPTRAFARALLGTVGEVTREQLDHNPGRYVVGEQVGQSGLQEQYDDLLRGAPGVRVVLPGANDAADRVIFEAAAQAGTPLRTTIDQRVQNAADAALAGAPLAGTGKRSALVAIRVSDAAVLAVANGPGGGEQDLALEASVPPGSIFKMVTALSLLATGQVTADSPVACPKTYTVQGRTFTNAGGFELGTVPFHTDFAKSCNTAFAALAPKLGGDGLSRAAASLGIGTTWSVGMPVVTGSVGVNMSTVESAAAAFGQGTTLVSPMCMAVAVAAIARGSWHQPTLLTELPADAGAPAVRPGPAGDPPVAGTAYPAAAVTALRDMMREVVTAGTATALADVPGTPVYAKTGTAEFNGNPADTHAWTIGWQGDVAFAVFVENGGASTDTAVPVVEAFLRGLA